MKIAITGHKKGIGKAFAEQLTANGFECLTGGTDSHIILLDT